MKTKLFLSVFFTQLLISTLFLSNSVAQDYTKWGLPEGAKARLGKGTLSFSDFIAYSPDGTRLAVASSIGIWLYDAQTYQELSLLTGHTEAIRSVVFSPDGQTLASGDYDTINKWTIRLWNAETGEHKQTLQGHTGWVNSVAFSPDGQTLASGSDDKTIRLWDVETGEHKQTLQGHTYWVFSVAFSPDGQTLASGSYDKTIRLWDAKTGEHQKTLVGHTDWVRSVAFSADGQTLASGSYDQTIRLWDAETRKHKQTLQGHTGRVVSVAFSADGQTLASGSDDNTIRLWDAETGEHKHTLQGHTSVILSVAFSPDGQTLASGSGDNTIRFWDAVTGEHKHTLQGHEGQVWSIAFSPDGQTLASGSVDETIRFWDAVTGEHKHTLQGHEGQVWSIAFSPDGQTLASGSRDNTIRLWDVETGEHKQTLAWYSIRSVSFSPDGQTLAGSSARRIVHLWDAETGEHKQTLQGHTDWVESVSFSPDGQTLASGSRDGTVLLWNATPTATTDATVHITVPQGQMLAIGDRLTCTLNITDGRNVAGYSVTVTYDSAALRYIESTNGDYLPADADFAPPIIGENRVTLSATSPAGESVGDGTLATLTFEVVTRKSSTLKLFAVSFVDTDGARSLPQTENTEIEVVQDPQSVDAKGKHYTKWGTLKTAEVYQNYPNPFNPETWIPYTLFETGNVKLSIFDTGGELIREFKLGHQTRGPKRIHWDGKNAAGETVASGIYFYQFEMGNTKSVHKMWLLK